MSEGRTIQEEIDWLARNLDADAKGEFEQWLKSKPKKKKRRVRKLVLPHSDGGRSYDHRPRWSEPSPREDNSIGLSEEKWSQERETWIQTELLPRLILDGDYKVLSSIPATSHIARSDCSALITSAIRISPDDNTIDIWATKRQRRSKQPPSISLFDVRLSRATDRVADESTVQIVGVHVPVRVLSKRKNTDLIVGLALTPGVREAFSELSRKQKFWEQVAQFRLQQDEHSPSWADVKNAAEKLAKSCDSLRRKSSHHPKQQQVYEAFPPRS